MTEEKGNLVDLYLNGEWVVVPTNTVLKPDRTNVMGKGVAFQLAQIEPTLPRLNGAWIETFGARLAIFPHLSLFTLPTKLEWWMPSPRELVERGVKQLAKAASMMLVPDKIYLPRLGCGQGKLDWQTQVKPMLAEHLNDKFVVVSVD